MKQQEDLFAQQESKWKSRAEVAPCRCADGYHHRRDAPQGSSPHHARAATRGAWPVKKRRDQVIITSDAQQARATHLVLVVRVAGLEERLVNASTAGDDAHHGAAIIAHRLARTGGQLDARLACVRILSALCQEFAQRILFRAHNTKKT